LPPPLLLDIDQGWPCRGMAMPPSCHPHLWPSPTCTSMSLVFPTLHCVEWTPAPVDSCTTVARSATPRRAQGVHMRARTRLASAADTPGHVVKPPARATSALARCTKRVPTSPAVAQTWPLARGNAAGDVHSDDHPPLPESSRQAHRHCSASFSPQSRLA
jgi:hypothetical protein